MIILGVDPGTLITGFGIIEVEHGTYSVLSYDVVKNSGNESMPIRLKRIYDRLCEIINQYHPDEFAIETAFYGKNAQSALKIGHARGVSILAAVNHELPTAEYSPREVKKAVTGNGAASKQQVQFMVQSQLAIREAPKYFDATDALAVALCHSFRRSRSKLMPRRKGHTASRSHRSWTEFIHAHPERIAGKK
ncbi:MAG: crossover junction endodeoxyribonuclease RuvC [Ignavibacteriae bacterium]|nr:MAG: crossover junction endodeoxyribonuclease RuvC [Ignavibacteriota bacterium]